MSGVVTESDSGFGNLAYSLQLNSNSGFSASQYCSGCTGWEQFVFANNPANANNTISGIFIQYWLFGTESCPSSWTYVPGGPGEAAGCYINSPMTPYKLYTVTNLTDLILEGVVGSGDEAFPNGEDEVVLFSPGESTATSWDSTLHLSQNWNTVEFNIFGEGNGTVAIFNNAATLGVLTYVSSTTAGPILCEPWGFTAEFTNFTLAAGANPACIVEGTALGGSIQFVESVPDSSLTPPSVTTLPASSVTINNAELNGVVNTSGWLALNWFQMSTDMNALTCTTPLETPATNYPPTTFPLPSTEPFTSAPPVNLSSGTTYYFVACTLDVGGLAVGNVMSFTTLPATYTIAGQATLYGNALQGATVTLSGSQTGTVVTGPSGDYSFGVVQGGNYTVTISMPGYYFYPYPSSITFDNLNSSETVNFQGAVVGDFDHAGHPDVIWQEPGVGSAQIWYLGGPMGVSYLQSADLSGATSLQIVGIGDFDENGTSDVVLQDPVSGAVLVWYLGGAMGNELIGISDIVSGNPWRVVSVADFNRDGHPDVLWQDPVSGLAQIWFLGGPQGSTLLGAANVTASNSWRIAGASDFNGDGVPDLVWQDPESGATEIWYMGGPQGNVVTSAAELAGANSWHIVAVADFNLDGHPDVVWQDPVTGESQVWFLTGAQGTTYLDSASLTGANSWNIVAPR